MKEVILKAKAMIKNLKEASRSDSHPFCEVYSYQEIMYWLRTYETVVGQYEWEQQHNVEKNLLKGLV